MPSKYLTVREELPLRGHLVCPQCKRILTGSASTGRHGNKFFYYHCSNGCKERKNANAVNKTFERMLHDFKANQNSLELYSKVVDQIIAESNTELRINLQQVAQDIEKQNQRLKNARSMAADGDITVEDYKEMKKDALEVLARLEARQRELSQQTGDFQAQAGWCVELLKNLDSVYMAVPAEKKQRIIGSIFPERLSYENDKYRTPKINRMVDLICSNSRQLDGDKKEKYTFLDVLSCQVVT